MNTDKMQIAAALATLFAGMNPDKDETNEFIINKKYKGDVKIFSAEEPEQIEVGENKGDFRSTAYINVVVGPVEKEGSLAGLRVKKTIFNKGHNSGIYKGLEAILKDSKEFPTDVIVEASEIINPETKREFYLPTTDGKDYQKDGDGEKIRTSNKGNIVVFPNENLNTILKGILRATKNHWAEANDGDAAINSGGEIKQK